MRVVAQFLEGGAASAAVDPDAAVACLRRASDIVPLSDLCLGWNLPPALIDAVADEGHHLGQRVWLWQPLLSGDGEFVPRDDAALGPRRLPIPWPREMVEFAFDCPVRRPALDAALARLDGALDRGPWDGVLLDKIRWPSPTRDPATDLACFCDDCQREASRAGVDLAAVAARLERGASPGVARRELLRELLGTTDQEPLASFMAWRAERITDAVTEAALLVAGRAGPEGAPLRVALDVFAPSLARLVGQDIVALALLGELTKAMLYLGTHGPAGLPYELCALATWLADGQPDEAVDEAVDALAEALCLPLPSGARLCAGSLDAEVFARELERLGPLAGETAAAGIDAIEVADIAVLDDATLGAVVQLATRAGVPLVLSWDLWATPRRRLEIVTHAIEDASALGVAS